MDVLWEITGWIWAQVLAGVDRLSRDAAYRDGFVSAVLLGLFAGLVYTVWDYGWSRIRKFFTATKGPPAASTGPAPADLSAGCLGGLLLVIVVGAFLALLVFRLFIG